MIFTQISLAHQRLKVMNVGETTCKRDNPLASDDFAFERATRQLRNGLNDDMVVSFVELGYRNPKDNATGKKTLSTSAQTGSTTQAEPRPRLSSTFTVRIPRIALWGTSLHHGFGIDMPTTLTGLCQYLDLQDMLESRWDYVCLLCEAGTVHVTPITAANRLADTISKTSGSFHKIEARKRGRGVVRHLE